MPHFCEPTQFKIKGTKAMKTIFLILAGFSSVFLLVNLAAGEDFLATVADNISTHKSNSSNKEQYEIFIDAPISQNFLDNYPSKATDLILKKTEVWSGEDALMLFFSVNNLPSMESTNQLNSPALRNERITFSCTATDDWE